MAAGSEDFDGPPQVRRCANCKSRANPDVQCNLFASHGDYCTRHYKNPRPFQAPVPPSSVRVFTRAEHAAATKVQSFWQRWKRIRAVRNQGPALFQRELSVNPTELYTLEPLSAVPALYYMSFADERRQIYGFDIRSLSKLYSIGQLSTNPYTREALSPAVLGKIRKRIEWLRKRKYNLLYTNGDILTPLQHWNQKVLDIFMRVDALGYYVSCDWFHEMDVEDHRAFYKYIYQLWYWRLGLSMQDRDLLVPGHATGAQKLFRWNPEQIPPAQGAKHHWWEKVNLTLIESLIGSANEKERRKLGAMYVVMGLTHVNDEAARTFPWVVDVD